jgi:ferredoxin
MDSEEPDHWHPAQRHIPHPSTSVIVNLRRDPPGGPFIGIITSLSNWWTGCRRHSSNPYLILVCPQRSEDYFRHDNTDDRTPQRQRGPFDTLSITRWDRMEVVIILLITIRNPLSDLSLICIRCLKCHSSCNNRGISMHEFHDSLARCYHRWDMLERVTFIAIR